MEFLFTEDNQNLQKLKNEWLAGNSFGTYVFVGESGSGKTTFLKLLILLMCKMCSWIKLK